jgi:rubrerythrin
MEEKDVNSIASAVSNALAKLNADTDAVKEKTPEKKELFTCPECGMDVMEGVSYCPACGCPLEWED